MADHFFLVNRIQHTLHCGLHVFDCLVNDFVKTEIHAFLLRKLFCHRVRADVESDDDRVGRSRQRNVGLIDSSYASMDHTDHNFFIGKFCKALFYRLYRSLYVSLDDDRQLLQIAGLDLVKEIVKRQLAFCLFQETVFVF